jgi:hypothetical protein
MEVGETLDVSGWEMARSLRPVRVLNASVLVWLASPIVCRKPPVFAGMKELAAGDHHPRVGICHCLDMREEPPRRTRAPEEVSELEEQGMGLRSMRERVKSLGGTFVVTADGKQFSVFASIPRRRQA